MSKPLARGGRTASFANLMSLVTGSRGARAEDDNKTDDTEDEAARKARRAEEDKKREDEDARRAEEDDRRKDEDARRAEEENDDKPKGEEGDDENCDEEDDTDPEKASAAKSGRRAENARWSRVLSAVKADQVAAACTMLADTRLNSAQILGTLNALPSSAPAQRGGRQSLQERMAQVRVPPLGGDGGAKAPAGSPAAVADFVLAADRRRRGEA